MIWRPLRSTLFPYTTLFRSGRNGLDVRDGGGERPLVCSQEISERAEQVRELIATEGFGDVFNAAGDIIDFLHDGAQVGLLAGGQDGFIGSRKGGRGAISDLDEILPEQ